LIWIGFNFSSYFSKYKNERLEKEVADLKGKLLDRQGELIKEIENNMRGVLEDFKVEGNKKLELYKKENEKTINNLSYEISNLKDKIGK